MTPIIPAQATITAEDSAVWLARYARIVQYPECAFWGVNDPAGADTGQCRTIWSKAQRDDAARYLAEAQQEIEDEIGYFLSPRWVIGQLSDQPQGDDRYVDSQPYAKCPRLLTRWPKLIEAGQQATANISLGEPVDHSTDPAVVGPIATAVTDPEEIWVYHPDTDVVIVPSEIVIAGGLVTIYVPRCRMVLAALADNPPEGLDYADVGTCAASVAVPGNFECEVDVKRIYNDPSVNAEIAWPHICNSNCLTNGCTERTQTACLYIRDAAIGEVDVSPANYSGGSWHGASLNCGTCGQPEIVRLYYRAGAKVLSRQAEDAIVRLAHAKMPDEPCGCEVTQRLWARDRRIPEVLDRERLNCPFGMSDGSWTAWRFARAMKLFRASVL